MRTHPPNNPRDRTRLAASQTGHGAWTWGLNQGALLEKSGSFLACPCNTIPLEHKLCSGGGAAALTVLAVAARVAGLAGALPRLRAAAPIAVAAVAGVGTVGAPATHVTG